MLDVWQLNETLSGLGKSLFYYQGLAEKIEDKKTMKENWQEGRRINRIGFSFILLDLIYDLTFNITSGELSYQDLF